MLYYKCSIISFYTSFPQYRNSIKLTAPLFFISKMIKIQKYIFLFLIMASISQQNQQLQASHNSIQQLQNNTFENISEERQIQQNKNSTVFSEQANKIYILCLQQLKESYSLDKKISCKTFKLFQKLFVQKMGNFDIKLNPTAKQLRAYHTFMLKKFGTTDKIIQQLSKQGVYQNMKQIIQKKFFRKKQMLNKKVLPKKGLMQRVDDCLQSKIRSIKLPISERIIKCLLLKHVQQCLAKGQYTLNENGKKIFPNMKLPIIYQIPVKNRDIRPKLQKQFQKLNLDQNSD